MPAPLKILTREEIPDRSGMYGAAHVCAPGGERRTFNRYVRAWCFKCRKRVRHQLHGFFPPMGSYYEPNFSWRCPNCDGDYRAFPGWE